jgi:hypothetical protein
MAEGRGAKGEEINCSRELVTDVDQKYIIFLNSFYLNNVVPTHL